ncbi:MAG: single-stranded-DNA-specific exonuclease RecJ [Eubacterium sp.]|nr:single-stranded-DNA-specific exonuclease RecJ [Eubacterium sp.]
MREKWMVRCKNADFFGLAKKYNIDPVVVRVIINRGVDPDGLDKYLNGSLSDLYDPGLLADVDKACDIMVKAIDEGTPTRIIGDYDIDGVNSTYILYRGLSKLGANVDYAIPHRITDGYGLSMGLIDDAIDDGRKLIVTCDNGIAAFSEIAYAKEKGLSVIVTDHHEVPFEEGPDGKREILPPADAVVDPKREDCGYPFPEICGAVVAMKVLQVLYARVGRDKDEPLEFLENAAFATVGDVMELKDENRIIVRYGLERINDTQNPGLRALINVNDIEKVNAYHFGFVLGPCVNATGRLDSAMKAMELLSTEDGDRAYELAGELVDLNSDRKDMTSQGVDAAVEMIEGGDYATDHVLVVHLPDIHESIAGIIAGRLRERYNKPSLVITGRGEEVKGSGRSIEAYSMFEEMSRVKELFTKFGGHPMAAGFSLLRSNVDELRRRLNENETLTDEDLMPVRVIDVNMPVSYITGKLIDDLEVLEPTGNGNSKPVFAQKDAVFVQARRIGKQGQYLKFVILTADGKRTSGLLFKDAGEFLEGYEEAYGAEALDELMVGRGTKKIKFCYYPLINEFRGMKSVEVRVEAYDFQDEQS